jgi:hypothetical protein
MFDWGQIWTVWRPIEWVNVMIGEKILTNSGYMGPGGDNIPMRRINALMNSMHRRIRAVPDARGGIQDIDELIDFTLTYWGVLLNWFQ